MCFLPAIPYPPTFCFPRFFPPCCSPEPVDAGCQREGAALSLSCAVSQKSLNTPLFFFLVLPAVAALSLSTRDASGRVQPLNLSCAVSQKSLTTPLFFFLVLPPRCSPEPVNAGRQREGAGGRR